MIYDSKKKKNEREREREITDCPENLWVPHSWRWPRPGWMGSGAVWSGGGQPCPQQGTRAWWPLMYLPTQTILWNKKKIANILFVPRYLLSQLACTLDYNMFQLNKKNYFSMKNVYVKKIPSLACLLSNCTLLIILLIRFRKKKNIFFETSMM